jgi:hypothetical protein
VIQPCVFGLLLRAKDCSAIPTNFCGFPFDARVAGASAITHLSLSIQVHPQLPTEIVSSDSFLSHQMSFINVYASFTHFHGFSALIDSWCYAQT